ncbi:serine/threonine protein kinase [Candidatus Uabimicrobium amorphum]|uniref:non-specific serine/threonine protein kinase n=1 Tax=Uabimicrobium amorphum TaxID=2596890 RepID=A0A5S9F6L2_UABAM|nr:protein kinase [Candidatus Uabimicrobium amorphum]BBM87812.1 serine/threonine protein kinase [Candidatus Uabimicrobium amorphum]
MLSTQIISLIKRLLGDVEIKKSLGSSSLGISYLIQHPQHDLCALKILQGKVTQNEKFLLKFLRDLEANCKIFHPGMAEIFAIMKKGNYFILRRYQEGETLRQTIQKHKKMSEPEATAVLVTIVNVLREFCTRHQALKNLKPNNIILHEDGVTITDYSLPPTIAHFLSPEQCKGKKSTIQSDIYTLGAIYHYCLTGQTLYHGPYKKIMQAHISQPYPKIQSEIPQPVLQILDKMLCKDPEKRYNSYENLLQDLNKQVNAKDALDFSGASNLEKTIDIQVALAKEENQIDTTRKLVRDMIKKELQEVDIVPDEPEEISLEKIVKNLEEITNLSIPGTATRTMQFPKELKNDVLLYLQEKFYRKCWIFNQTNNDLELEIDIQEARIIQHLYHFEEHLKKIISDYKGFVENDGLTDFTGLQQHNIRIVQGNFNDQKHINIENSDSALENSKLNVKIASKDESSQEEGYGLPQLSGGDETVVGDLPQQSNTKEEHPSNFDSDLTIVGDQQVAPNASVPNLESDATIVASEGLPQVVDKVDNSLDSAMPNLESDATIVGGDGLPQVVDEVDTHNTFASNATIVSGNVRDFANNDANSETSYFQTDASEQPQESGGYFSPDAPILQQGTPENEGYFSPEFANSFTSDATIVSEEVSEVAQQVTDEHQHDEDSTDKNQHQDPAPLPQLSQESNFASDPTVVSDAISKVAQAIENSNNGYFSSDTDNSEGLPEVVGEKDSSMATDATIVGGNLSDFVAKEPDATPSYFESDSTILGNDLPQVVQEVENNTADNSMATDATIVGGNLSDFVAKEPDTTPSYFESDSTILGNDLPQVVQEVENNTADNSMATDATIVGGNLSDFVAKEPDTTPSYFESDSTILGNDLPQVVQEVENNTADNSMATDATIVGGNLSDFVAKEPDTTPSYFESDSTILGNDLPQVVQEVENNTADNSMATDATIVGGNLSDFVAKEPDATPSYFESDSTILGNDLPQVVQEVENNTADNSMATDVTVVGGNLSDFVAKEPDHTPNLEYDVTIVGDPTSANSQHQVLESDATIVGNNTANAVQSTPPSSNTASQQLDKKASISTTETRQSEKSRSALNSNDPTSFIMQVAVNFSNSYEVQSWKKFIEENDLKKGESYALIAIKEPKTHIFYVKLDWALHYFELKQKSTSIKDFFQSDYEISELGRGGMGMVLKLTTKFDGTILSIRPENRWSREYFKDHLCIRKGINNQEIVYAELPSGKSFVVKVAFKGCEESLIHEGNCLEKIAQREKISRCVVGLIQQGCLMAKNQEDNTHLGYYAMMEYGGDIATDQLCSMFPDNKLPITVGFMLLYGLTHALIELKEEGVIHRDIKPQNILLTEAGMPKLFDFGLAITTHAVNSELNEDNRRLLRVLDSDFLRISTECEFVHKRLKRLYERKVNMEEFNEQEMNHINNKIKMLETTGRQLQKKEHERAAELQHLCRPVTAEENVERPFAGSLYYAAPEQFKHENVLTHQCDVYQLGATLFTVLTGKKVVKAGNLHKLVEVILYSEKPRLDEHLPKTNLVKALSNLLVQMMRNKPQERIEIEAVKDELNNILFNHLDELTKPPIYDASNIQDPQARSDYYRKIAFVQRMFMKCLRNLHTYLDKLEKEQQENKKIFFTCPGCTKKLHISATMVGQKGCCPNCRHPIVVQITE